MTDREKYIVERIKERIKEKDNTAGVILYGSHAKGNAREESDWDLLILLDREEVNLKTEQDYRHYLLDLELEIGEPISVFVYSKKSWESKHSVTPLYHSIKQEGIYLI